MTMSSSISKTHTKPTVEDLHEMYGDLTAESTAVAEVSVWGQPNNSEIFSESDNLGYLEQLHESFESAAEEVLD